MATLLFVGDEKCIKVIYSAGEFTHTINVKELYSAWKEWVIQSDNAKYLQAFTSIGGEQISPTEFIGYTVFIKNGWTICPNPVEEETKLLIDGNLYPEVSGTPVYDYSYVGIGKKTHVEMRTSLLPTLMLGGSGLTTEQANMLIAISKLVKLIPATL